jgi:hypothetical protein
MRRARIGKLCRFGWKHRPRGPDQLRAPHVDPGTYTLSFDLIGSQRGTDPSTTVNLGSLYDQTFALGSTDDTDGIVSYTFDVSSTTVAPLIFTSNDGPSDVGALLDNVDLAAVGPTPAPESATLLLIAIGFLGLLTLGRFAIAK